MIARLLLLALSLGGAGAARAGAARAGDEPPTIDCARPASFRGGDEPFICANPSLAAAEASMASAYRRLLAAEDCAGADLLSQQQDGWVLFTRTEVCLNPDLRTLKTDDNAAPKVFAACAAAYAARIAALRAAYQGSAHRHDDRPAAAGAPARTGSAPSCASRTYRLIAEAAPHAPVCKAVKAVLDESVRRRVDPFKTAFFEQWQPLPYLDDGDMFGYADWIVTTPYRRSLDTGKEFAIARSKTPEERLRIFPDPSAFESYLATGGKPPLPDHKDVDFSTIYYDGGGSPGERPKPSNTGIDDDIRLTLPLIGPEYQNVPIWNFAASRGTFRDETFFKFNDDTYLAARFALAENFPGFHTGSEAVIVTRSSPDVRLERYDDQCYFQSPHLNHLFGSQP